MCKICDKVQPLLESIKDKERHRKYTEYFLEKQKDEENIKFWVNHEKIDEINKQLLECRMISEQEQQDIIELSILDKHYNILYSNNTSGFDYFLDKEQQKTTGWWTGTHGFVSIIGQFAGCPLDLLNELKSDFLQEKKTYKNKIETMNKMLPIPAKYKITGLPLSLKHKYREDDYVKGIKEPNVDTFYSKESINIMNNIEEFIKTGIIKKD